MNIIELKIEELIPYDKNPRKNDKAVPKVAASIQQFGFKVPIIIDKDNIIIAGHTRYLAAKQLELETVPVIKADDLNEQQIKAFRLADNKVSEYSEWDDDLLKDELQSLLDLDFDINDIGFSEIELMELTEDIEPEEYDEDEIQEYVDEAERGLKATNIVISCFNEEEEAWVRGLLKEDSTIRRLYKAEDLIKRYEENN